MSRVIFALFICAVALVSYSECAPSQSSAEVDAEIKAFEKRRDDSIRYLIEKEGLTCENVNEFCSRNKDSDNEDDNKAAALYCEIVLQPLVCEGQQL